MKKFIPVFIFITIVLAGCATAVAPSGPSSSADGSLTPSVLTFKAIPASIVVGNETTLKWEVENAGTVKINQGIGTVALKGQRLVRPGETTSFILTATNKYGSATSTVEVVVMKEAPASTPSSFNLPVVSVFKAEPANIMSGDPSTLSWEVQNSFDVTIDPGLSIITPKGSKEVSPTFPTTYKLTATNGNGSIMAATTLTVSFAKPFQYTPKISYFTANPYVIKRGETAELSWQSTDASSASMDNGIGTVDGSGTIKVKPDHTTLYMLTVTSPQGAQFQTTVVNVK